jgi:uncharacterized protein (TIGR03437 family)
MRTPSARTKNQRVKGKFMNRFRLLRTFSVLFALTVGTSCLHAATLAATVTTINLLCTVGQACASTGSPSVAFNTQSTTLSNASGTDAFTIAAPNVPWLTVSPLSGSVVNPSTVAVGFTVNTVGWLTLPVGLNSTTIPIVSGTGGTVNITVNLQVQAAAGTLTVKGGTNVLNPFNYVATSPTVAVTMSFTVVSTSGLAVPFTVAATSTTTTNGAVSNWLTVAAGSSSGIAYSFGATVSVVASQAAIAAAFPGDYLVGSVVITPNGVTANNVTVPVNIFVGAAAPTISVGGISPAVVPLLANGVAPGFVTFVIHGSGFISQPAVQKTKVFYGTTALLCNNLVLTDYVTWINSNYIQVTVPNTATGSPFNTAGATALFIGVANGATPVLATATISIGVTAAPIISAVTSASSFVELASPKAAPYDIISIFGTNFCPTCTGTNNVLVGAVDAFTRFPAFLSPDGGTTKITVIFGKTITGGTPLPGYLLFATNNQINVAVPGALTSAYGFVQVAFDTATPPAAGKTSTGFPLGFVAADPGIFTIESSGQGQAAALNLNTAGSPGTVVVLNSITNPAIGGAASAAVSLYLSGLGVPDAVGGNGAQVSQGAWTAVSNAFNCISPIGAVGTSALAPTGYMGTVNTAYFSSVTGTGFQQPSATYVVPSPLWTSIDGAVINLNELNTNVAAPCFLSADAGAVPGTNALITVTVTGVGTPAVLTPGAGITYAGFVAGSVSGLYQINFTVPVAAGNGSTATPATVVVSVGSGGTVVSSQPGVTMYIE